MVYPRVFLVAINDVTKCVKFLLSQGLFADDYNISVRSSEPLRTHRLLQQTLNSITTWSLKKKGFKFSSHLPSHIQIKKSHTFTFTKCPNHSTQLCKTFRNPFWSKTYLSPLPPCIKILKAECIRAFNIIKYISHPSKGCNKKLLVQFYKSLIRSRLDYGAPDL